MSDYIFKHTDLANGSFAVKPFTANGPATPSSSLLYTSPDTGESAVSADTSLILVGKGFPHYGPIVEQNLIYMMEHFASKIRPRFPMQGQLWFKNQAYADPAYPADPTAVGMYVYTGTAWSTVVVSGSNGGDLDLNGFKVVNTGNATNPGDLVNMATGDTRYIKTAGVSAVTGNVTFSSGTLSFAAGATVSITDVPTIPAHATNKSYVDQQITAVSNSVNAFGASLANYVSKTGDTMSGPLNLGLNASLVLGSGGTGTVNVGSRRVEAVGAPVVNTDATHKLYVDTAISAAIAAIPPSSGATADGVVNGGSLNSTTGALTLTRTMGLPAVTITGVAPFNHTHTSQQVSFDMANPYNQSYFLPIAYSDPSIAYPRPAIYNMLLALDQAAYDSQRPVHRQVIKQTVGGTTTFVLNDNMAYNVNENKLHVHVNGQKYYANERGRSTVKLTASIIGLNSLTGLAAGPYSFTLTVNGTPYVITVTIAANSTYMSVIVAIINAMSTASVPANAGVEQYLDHMEFFFDSNTTGIGSSVTVSYLPGELFKSMTAAAAPIDTSVTTSLGYTEVGTPGNQSTTITFVDAPPLNALIEVLRFA